MAFKFDADCGTFKTHTPPTTPATAIRPGAWVVGSDILPALASIIANDFMPTGGAAFVTIAPIDTAFKTDADCGTWTRTG